MSDTIGTLVAAYRRGLHGRRFFDLNLWCDLPPHNTFYLPEGLEQIVEDLRGCGIDRAVVSSAACIEYDPLHGNERTVGLIADQPDLFGAMVLVPDIGLDGRAPESYIDEKGVDTDGDGFGDLVYRGDAEYVPHKGHWPGPTAGWLGADFMEETSSSTGVFVSIRPFQIGTRADFGDDPRRHSHIVGP